jgi:hypothetical protein
MLSCHTESNSKRVASKARSKNSSMKENGSPSFAGSEGKIGVPTNFPHRN